MDEGRQRTQFRGLTALAGGSAVREQRENYEPGSWTELYGSVLRLRPVLEQPPGSAEAAEGLRVHGDFCRWLRMYLLSAGQADEVSLARQETEAAVALENWHALWSDAKATRRGRLVGR